MLSAEDTLPMGVQRARFPRKDFRPVFNLEAEISTEVLERLYPFVPLDDLRGRLTSEWTLP